MQCQNDTNNTTMEKKGYTYEYPRPALTADNVVFGYDGKQLHILLIKRGMQPFKGLWALPGGFWKPNETIEACAKRELEEETGVKDIYLEQFKVFSNPNRDPREQVITVAFVALVRKSDFTVIGGDDAEDAKWFVYNELPILAFDHQDIVEAALQYLRERLRIEPIAFRLLDKYFTMTELQTLYETINGVEYDRRNFARKMLASNFIEERVDEEIVDCCYCQTPMMDMEEDTAIPTRRSKTYLFEEENYEKATKDKHKRKFPFDF